jgi:hypothetical protein
MRNGYYRIVLGKVEDYYDLLLDRIRGREKNQEGLDKE